jgi:hydrogenase maturation factor HypF (carbamoyltransferase family)
LKTPAKSRSVKPAQEERLRMFLVPCSCGATFAVAGDYDRRGTSWSRYMICPQCGKRHDPKNRLLEIGYQREGYWKVDNC